MTHANSSIESTRYSAFSATSDEMAEMYGGDGVSLAYCVSRLLTVGAQVICVPSLILYVLEAVVVLMNRKGQFTASFYRLFIARFVASTISFFNYYPYIRFSTLGVFASVLEMLPGRLLTMTVVLNYWMLHAENIATLMILLNRLTSIYMPARHYRMWTSRYIIPLIFLLPIPALILPNYDSIHYVMRTPYTSDSYFVEEIGPSLNGFYSNAFTGVVVSSVIFVLCVATNVATLVGYRRNVSRTVWPRAERRLTSYALATFFSQTTVILYLIVAYFLRRVNYRLNFLIYHFGAVLIDLCTVAWPAWMMLWADRNVCAAITHRFLLSRQKTSIIRSSDILFRTVSHRVTPIYRHVSS